MASECELYEDLLVQEVLGEIGEKERMFLKRHLDSCSRCRAELSVLANAVTAMRRERHVEAPAGLAQRTMQRVERAGERFVVAASPYHHTRLLSPSTWRIRRSLVGWMVAASVLVMAVASLVPGMMGADSKQSIAACQEHMRILATALQQYAVDHNGFYPVGTEWYKSLDHEYLKGHGALLCPGRLAVGRGSARETDYLYNPQRQMTNAPADYPLLWDRKAAHDQLGRNVLFVGGRVDWVSEENFEKILAKYKIDEAQAL